MNAKQRLTYWRKVERLRAQLDRKYFNATKQSILKQFKRFAGDIKKIGTSAAISRLGLDLWEKELIKVFENLYKEATLQFGNATYRVLKIEANQKQQTFGFNAQWTKEVNDFLANQGFSLVSDITKTTKDKMTSIVQKAIEQGLSTDEIVRVLLSDEQINYAVFRARRIVRTEVMRASNMGAMVGAQSHGFEVDKQWIAARDKRTRRIPEEEFDHWDMDGKVVAFDEPFTSTSKKGQPVEAMQPGDITAPAGFTINCRCTVGFIPKRDKDGRLVMKPKINGVDLPRMNIQNVVNQEIEQIKPETKEDIAKNIQNIFNNNSNLRVKNVYLSDRLTLEQFKNKRDTLKSLTDEYNISPAIDKNYETNIAFNSTSRAYGFVRSSHNGKIIYDANFGDQTGSARDRTFNESFTGIRNKSRVDEKNLELSTTVHEFAHLIALRHQLKQSTPPTLIVDYYKELRKLNRGYKKELKEYTINEDYYNRNKMALGDYANTNIDEFMAEAFTEYRLSSNPSKYAVLVGKLIDKYFKK